MSTPQQTLAPKQQRRKKRKQKVAATTPAKPPVLKTNRLVARYLPSKGSRNKFPGELMDAGGNLVQMPDLTHALTPSDRIFLANILDPCDERLGPSSGSKIPDGTLVASGVNGFREAFNVSPPFDTTETPGGPLGGPVWTLGIMRLPTLRNCLFLLASNSASDFSLEAQQLFAAAVSSASLTVFPVWHNLLSDGSLKASRVLWSQLRNIPNLNTLFGQVRITKYGLTTFHNTPDLYNQGMVMTAQWNCDKSTRQEREFQNLTPPVTSVNPVVVTRSAIDTPTGGSVTLPSNVQLPLLPTPLGDSVATETLSAQALGFTGTVRWTSQDPSTALAINETDSVRVSVLGVTTGVDMTILVIPTTGAIRSVTLTVAQSGTGNVTADITWTQNTQVVDAVTNDIEMPPLDTQSIIQSTPKAVYLPMKEFNGAYNVGRFWEPVFGMQETDQEGPLRLRRRGGAFPDVVYTGEQPDLLDLNFGTVVQVCTGLSLAASVAIKAVMDIEFVANDLSPWSGFMNPNESVDTEVVSLARAVALTQPLAYPQTYNSLGTLLEGISSLLENIPVIGHAVPLVTRFVKSLTNTNHSPPNVTNAACEIDGGTMKNLLSQILQNLGRR